MASSSNETPTTYLKDYTEYPYDVENVTLEFDLEEDHAVVTATSVMSPKGGAAPLVLDGRESFMELLLDEKHLVIADGHPGRQGVCINDKPLSPADYVISKNAEDSRLTISSPPTERFTLGIVTKFKPQDNLELSGLYKSSGNFCTQCEAEGFRLITYFPDRPDVMSIFTTKIRADKTKYPVLLSNGNLVESCDLADGRHMAVWVDPWRKPCYLFALVAGDLARITDEFVTASGRKVELRIYAEQKNIDRCDFAMASLKRAMKWDEDTFGLEYDLDLFNIVAVDDFNMGAMENKSLNLFNSRLVLATPDSATDAAFGRIEGVIGHEYFHNWTGNRVTCRDWFQLSLKEGLTVFRDQQFSGDMMSRSVKRIGDVRYLRDAQFAEDASPMSHPVRPASYMKIDNFYTLTVYEKGAEVIRMYHTLLGKDGFRKGMDLYFERHDGQAVTTDDFFAAMTDANGGNDISRLKNWYSQAGTPTLRCFHAHDTTAGTFTITLEQVLPKTPDNPDAVKEAQLIPVAVGLISVTGKDIIVDAASITVSDEEGGSGSTATPATEAGTVILRLNAMKATFTFNDVCLGAATPPVPSVLRAFSAPVKLEMYPPFSTHDLLFTLAHDSDPFNRWESSQIISRGIMTRTVAKLGAEAATLGVADVGAAVRADDAWEGFVAACRGIIADATADAVDRAWVEEALSFPGVGPLVQELAPVDPLAVFAVVKGFGVEFAKACESQLVSAYQTCKKEAEGLPYEVTDAQTARRSLIAYALRYLGLIGHGGEEATELANAAKCASNMTETVAALGALSRHPTAESARREAFDAFLQKWKDDNNVICTYLSLVAGMVHCADPLENVKRVMESEVFSMKVPNKFYALVGGFARANTPGFHASDGSGYKFLTDCLLKMDEMNAIAASRVAKPFTEWRLYDPARQEMMKAELKRILDSNPSPNLYEICTKSLA